MGLRHIGVKSKVSLKVYISREGPTIKGDGSCNLCTFHHTGQNLILRKESGSWVNKLLPITVRIPLRINCINSGNILPNIPLKLTSLTNMRHPNSGNVY